jgi:heat-inducible transcriptional repressor
VKTADKSILREKDKHVLHLIVEQYLESGHPVSSGKIFLKKAFPGSPATLRNIMVRLEERGFLSQPHASAGRVPTDQGLRFYVNSLFAEIPFAREESLPAPGSLAPEGDLGSLLLQVSRTLAEHSDNLGFVITPRLTLVHFRSLRFMKISENRIMVILVTPSQMVLTQIVESKAAFSQVELDRAAQYINQNFRGKNLVNVRDFLVQELPKYRLKYEDIIDKLSALIRAYVSQETEENRIILQGTSSLLDKAELFDMVRLRVLFRNFEEKAILTRLLSDFISLDRVKVLIGSETNNPSIQDCSLVMSHYGYSNQVLGSLGIIGPKRIPYERIIPLVDSVAQRLSRALGAMDQEVMI